MSSDGPTTTGNDRGPRPVCFMVMPFRRRKVEGNVGEGAPGELDCDALWDRVFRPVIVDLGYVPIRADAETGAVIVKDMLERLAFAHLVLADVSLPNGNVYYEIGLRHVARQTGCVLLAASWSRQLFDIDQFRAVRYTLVDGLVPEEEAAGIRDHLKAAIPPMADATTPWHEHRRTPGRRQCAHLQGSERSGQSLPGTHAQRPSVAQVGTRGARPVDRRRRGGRVADHPRSGVRVVDPDTRRGRLECRARLRTGAAACVAKTPARAGAGTARTGRSGPAARGDRPPRGADCRARRFGRASGPHRRPVQAAVAHRAWGAGRGRRVHALR